MDDNNIQARKKEHLEIAASDVSRYKNLTNGFEKYRFVHCALPEMDYSEVEIDTEFLGYELSCPLIINPISGGEINGKHLNEDLAQVASEERIGLSLGSIRAALVDKGNYESFSIVNSYARNIPLIVNIGCLQIKDAATRDALLKICGRLGADAISVHLNPLQEILQPEGGSNFKGVLKAIRELNRISEKPIIIKEVGFGLSKYVVEQLREAGIKWIDISGSGGTSWSRIEAQRIQNRFHKTVAEEFEEWGIPTAKCLTDIKFLDDINIIASGGISTGQDFAKAIALGADFVGLARAIVSIWNKSGCQGIKNIIKRYRKVLKLSLFSTGCKNIEEFQNKHEIIVEVN